MLAKNLTVAQVAEAIGVARETVYRWLREESFASEVERLRRLAETARFEQWEKLADEHFAAASQLREIVVKRLEEIAAEQQSGVVPSSREVRDLAEALVKAIGAERQAVSLDYLDSNRAIAEVARLGFTVTDAGSPVVEVVATEQ